MRLRSALHAGGLRYRVNYRATGAGRRTIDVAFTRRRLAVFVDGCFWHCCPTHGTMPATNRDYWASKLARNVERDRETDRLLESHGWTVVRIWEHDSIDNAFGRIKTALADTVPSDGCNVSK